MATDLHREAGRLSEQIVRLRAGLTLLGLLGNEDEVQRTRLLIEAHLGVAERALNRALEQLSRCERVGQLVESLRSP